MFGSAHWNSAEDACSPETALMGVGVAYWIFGLASLLGHWFVLSALLCLLGSLFLVGGLVVKQVRQALAVEKPEMVNYLP